MSTVKTLELTKLINRALKESGILRNGNNLTYRCPKCHHRKRKLEVCIEPPYKYHCWVCDFKGRGIHNLFKAVGAHEELVSALNGVVKHREHSVKKPGAVFKDQIILSLTDATPIKEEVYELPPNFRSLADNDGTIEYKIAINYAKKRRLTMYDIIKHNIGYCAKGPFANRLVVPSYDKDNNLNFYSCRSYYDDGYKYKNSEFSKNIIGFENLIDFDFPIYLCEGALDAIALRRNAIPLFGKTLSQKLKSAITTSNCPEINVVLDDDALGSAIKIAQWGQSVGKVVKVVKLRGKDPSVLGFEATLQEIKNTDMLDFSGMMKLRLE